MTMFKFMVCTLGVTVATTAAAHEETSGPSSPKATASAAASGYFLPQTSPAQVGTVAATGVAYGGYDGSGKRPIFSAAAEVTVWGPFALRAGAEYGAVRGEMRPAVMARAQVLRQSAHGIDGAVSVSYRAEGFTELEGEVETAVAVGRRFGRTAILGNLVYGQDGEGNERDGELRMGLLYALGDVTVGLDGRARFAIGPQRTGATRAEPKFDLLLGPTAVAVVGPVALFGQAGLAALKTDALRAGPMALAGLGSAF